MADTTPLMDGDVVPMPPAVRVGVNGFGRIGRQAVRIMTKPGATHFKLCHINSTRE